tara:strand:+ start:1638 stop:1784 length:147 start_codon:yes stop_codon:yes gene_type:complete
MLNLKDIKKRLGEIPLQLNELQTELQQLRGYQQALLDIEKDKKVKEAK